MKFKVERDPQRPGYDPMVHLSVWMEGEWNKLPYRFQSILSAKEYAIKYKNEVYEEEFEL